MYYTYILEYLVNVCIEHGNNPLQVPNVPVIVLPYLSRSSFLGNMLIPFKYTKFRVL